MFTLILESLPFNKLNGGSLRSQEFEAALKQAGFTTDRKTYPVSTIVTGVKTFQRRLVFPNLFSWLNGIDVRQLEMIRLQTDADFHTERKLSYIHPEEQYLISQYRNEKDTNNCWQIYLCNSKRDMLGNTLWGEALTRFQEMAQEFVEQIAIYTVSGQIQGLADMTTTGTNTEAVKGIAGKAQIIRGVATREYQYPPIDRGFPDSVMQHARFQEHLVHYVIQGVTDPKEGLGLTYLGQTRIGNISDNHPKIKLYPQYGRPDEWPDDTVERELRSLFFTLPGWQVILELHLYQDNQAVWSEPNRADWKYQHQWSGVLRGIVPYTTPGLHTGNKAPHKERLHLNGNGTCWEQPNLGDGCIYEEPIHTENPKTDGDLHVAKAYFEFGRTHTLNERRWTFISAFMNVLRRVWWGSNLLRYALPGKISSLQGMLPTSHGYGSLYFPDTGFQDCMDYYWQTYPIAELMKYCEPGREIEYLQHTQQFSNEDAKNTLRTVYHVKC